MFFGQRDAVAKRERMIRHPLYALFFELGIRAPDDLLEPAVRHRRQQRPQVADDKNERGLRHQSGERKGERRGRRRYTAMEEVETSDPRRKFRQREWQLRIELCRTLI